LPSVSSKEKLKIRSLELPLTERFLKAREDFPSLRRVDNGVQLAYLDGPAGTQVPQQVIDAMSRYYATSNANTHGCFITSKETDALLEEARCTAAVFLGTPDSSTISFGANMTTLTFSLSRAIGRTLQDGDEVVISQLDHEANRGPWLTLRERGVVIKEIPVRPNATLDEEEMRSVITERTKLVAIGMSSNAFGTVNNVELARELSANVGAWLFLDAVHYAPHFSIDVQKLDTDFLVCSAYKFYGPHVGMLYSRKGLLEHLETDRLRTQDPTAPFRMETGTLNHAAIVGVRAAIDYLASFGEGSTERERLVTAMNRIASYEHSLAASLYAELGRIAGVTVCGVAFDDPHRAPTVSFTLDGKTPEEICTRMAEHGICVWDGHFYAIRPMEVLGLLEQGGVTRVGISLYNTSEEIERLLETVRLIASEN